MTDNRTTSEPPMPVLLQKLLDLPQAHRPAFRPQHPFRRVGALPVAELLTFARHTVAQDLPALGLTMATGMPGTACLAAPASSKRH